MSQSGMLGNSTSPAADVEYLVGDSGGAVGPNGSFEINVLGNPDIDVVGNPGTNTLQMTNLTKVSKYVVDSTAGAAPYQTIQAALNDIATDAVDALVYIRPGTYTENLTFPDQNVTMEGDRGGNIIISGTHTPSAVSSLSLDKIQVQSATDIFNSAAAGAGNIELNSCFVTVTNGYVYNLPNWTGTLLFDDSGDGSTNNGVVNNTSSASIKFINSEIGAGSGQTMTLSGTGTVRFDTCNISCPISITGSGSVLGQNGCKFANTMTIGGSRTGTIVNSAFITGANAAFVMSSSGVFTLSDVSIDSSNATPIQGAGAGDLALIGVLMVDEQQVGASVITPELNFDARGNGSTVGAVTADLLTWTMPSSPCVIVFDSRVAGFDSVTPAGVGYNVFGSVRTDGVTATLVGTPDKVINEEAALAAADANLVVSGNSAIVRVTGVAGLTLSWTSYSEFTQVGL